jgi:superfamily I DNA/RNA helicase
MIKLFINSKGAEINNILQFKKKYPKTKVITLSKNYRSTKEIVDFSQIIISQGELRLANQIKEIEKKLEAANPTIAEGAIIAHTFDTVLHENIYVANEIKK